jgi:hypothetical protein
VLMKRSHACRIWRCVDKDTTFLWHMMLCYWRDGILAKYDALLMVSHCCEIWRCADEEITVLRNVTLCW